jgi:ubiquinone/menaquinone biosynthesis C-methylase UbiE
MNSLFDFNTQASTYDDYYKSEFGRRIDESQKECVNSFLEKILKGKILELGSGTGHWSEWLASHGFEVLGIDIADGMLNQAKNKKLSNCTFQKMSMTDLEFNDNSVENIIAITSLEFSTDLEKTFSEIKRVLRPNGNFIAAVLNADSIIGRTKKDNPTFKNANFFTEEELVSRLSEFGLPRICKAAFINDNFEIDNKGDATMLVGWVSLNQNTK